MSFPSVRHCVQQVNATYNITVTVEVEFSAATRLYYRIAARVGVLIVCYYFSCG